jgi:hypothetical protein
MDKGNFRSEYEFKVAQFLSNRKVTWEYETLELEYFLNIKGGRCNNCESEDVARREWYIPDFWLPDLGIIIEAKGRWESKDRTKMIQVLASHPDLDIRMLFMRDNWLTKQHKKRYSHYCNQKGIKYTVDVHGKVPLAWLRGK